MPTSVPILYGVKADNKANLRQTLPVNLEPTLVESGLSKGYLRSTPGITSFATGSGIDRGGIEVGGVLYRVIGPKLVSVSSEGVVAILGDVENDSKPVRMDYSFDHIGIASNLKLWLWDRVALTLTQNTDPDLGDVVDVQWIDGYWMTTDGTSVVVTELSDPFAVDPLKYGSSEADPDSVVGLLKVPGESVVLNRTTCEFLRNIGGTGFPFQRIQTAQIDKGCVGAHAKCRIGASFAFVGGGRGEQVSVYVAGNGTAQTISTPEIDAALNALSAANLALVEMETRLQEGEERLILHIPGGASYVFMPDASSTAQVKIWYQLGTGVLGTDAYPLKHLVWCYGKWIGGTSTGVVGYLDATVKTHLGEIVGERFDTLFAYNKGAACILGQIELTGLPGRTPFGTDPKVWFSFTRDGETYSQERPLQMGGFGVRRERVVGRPNVRAGKYLGLRFRSANTSFSGWASLEAEVEGLG